MVDWTNTFPKHEIQENVEPTYFPDTQIDTFGSQRQAENALEAYKQRHPDWKNARLIEKTGGFGSQYFLVGSTFGYVKKIKLRKSGKQKEEQE